MFIYLIKKYNIIFIFNPKCACSSIKKYISNIEELNYNKERGKIHKYNWNNIKKEELITKYKDVPVVFFKRRPVDRLMSGYKKVLNSLINKIGIVTNKSKEYNSKILKNGNIDVLDFIDVLLKHKNEDLEVHFRSQTYGIGDILRKRHIYYYDIDNLQNINKYLKNEFNINVNANVDKKYNYYNKKNEIYDYMKKYYKNNKYILPKSYENKINLYFRDDYELLGYNTIINHEYIEGFNNFNLYSMNYLELFNIIIISICIVIILYNITNNER